MIYNNRVPSAEGTGISNRDVEAIRSRSSERPVVAPEMMPAYVHEVREGS